MNQKNKVVSKLQASVLINNYNYGRYLEQCIESVLNQTHENVEIIVYDDGSTDNSLDVLEKYKNKVIIIVNENYGKTQNLNQANAIYQAFLKSTGDIIFLLDSDDAFNEKKIEKVVNFFRSNPETDAVQHKFFEINHKGQITDTVRPVINRVDNYKDYIFSVKNLFQLFVQTSGLAFKRVVLEKMLPFDEDLYTTVCIDTRLMIGVSLFGKIATLDEPLGYYRVHGENTSNRWGSIEGHQLNVNEVYAYFNQYAVKHGYPTISIDHKTFLESTYFYNQLSGDKIEAYMENQTKENDFWIWGAGEAGQSVLHFLKDNQNSIKGFIDLDQRKQHQIVMGKKVFLPEEVGFSKNTKIIVSPYHAYGTIAAYLDAIGMVEELNFISPFK